MATFVALKLCPHLICLSLNFAKYTQKAQEVRAILADYDPRFESSSIDEAYLNITQYCGDRNEDPEAAVSQLRARVHSETGVTVSAGIAPNAKLAKISSNRNKPDGQCRVPSDRATIMAFMKDMPTRKVNGVGRVFERELAAIGIHSCGDIYPLRGHLAKVFGEKAFQFLTQCYLGLGRTAIQPAEEHGRKSVGRESTFGEISHIGELQNKLRQLAEELAADLKRTEFKGRTLVLKVKLHTYEVLTRQIAPPIPVSLADDLYKHAAPMLAKLEKNIAGMKLRLMGLRVTHLVSTKKLDLDFFGRMKCPTASTTKPSVSARKDSESEWEMWPEAEFEEEARQERADEMDALEAFSQECETPQGMSGEGEVGHAEAESNEPNTVHGHNPRDEVVLPTSESLLYNCPICHQPQARDDKTLNDHIDFCLSRTTIKEAVEATSTFEEGSASTPWSKPLERQRATVKRKRGPPQAASAKFDAGRARARKRALFL